MQSIKEYVVGLWNKCTTFVISLFINSRTDKTDKTDKSDNSLGLVSKRLWLVRYMCVALDCDMPILESIFLGLPVANFDYVMRKLLYQSYPGDFIEGTHLTEGDARKIIYYAAKAFVDYGWKAEKMQASQDLYNAYVVRFASEKSRETFSVGCCGDTLKIAYGRKLCSPSGENRFQMCHMDIDIYHCGFLQHFAAYICTERYAQVRGHHRVTNAVTDLPLMVRNVWIHFRGLVSRNKDFIRGTGMERMKGYNIVNISCVVKKLLEFD
jgi:hypothetical protein